MLPERFAAEAEAFVQSKFGQRAASIIDGETTNKGRERNLRKVFQVFAARRPGDDRSPVAICVANIDPNDDTMSTYFKVMPDVAYVSNDQPAKDHTGYDLREGELIIPKDSRLNCTLGGIAIAQ